MEAPPLRSISMKAISAQMVSLAIMPLHQEHRGQILERCACLICADAVHQAPPLRSIRMKASPAQMVSLAIMPVRRRCPSQGLQPQERLAGSPSVCRLHTIHSKRAW